MPRQKDGGQANGDVIQYVIDGQNRRIGKKVNGVVTQRFLYSGNLIPIAELDSVGNIVARFVGMYIVTNGNTYRLITDHLGSVRLVVNVSTGEVVQRIDYDEYGNDVLNTNPDFQPFGFCGGLYDNQTQLVKFGARDYDAMVGRWTEKDPIGFGGGDPDLYSYALENPVSYVDKDGLSCLVFNRLTSTLRLYDWMGNLVAAFNAANNVENPKGDPCKKDSYGPAPNGVFAVGPPRKPYNPKMRVRQGSFVFPLGRAGDAAWLRTLEIHAGRTGYAYPTGGCIRVDESTIQYLYNYYQLDPIKTITIEDQYRFIGGMELWENCY
ncbi:MAG: RHS repeat-associated core domain-containing protein [Candidatus Kryptoniota bacterium]